ncbi:hypothetical protein D3C85_1940970 [compost metagenome]
MDTLSPLSISVMLRPLMALPTASLIWALNRRKKRSRLTADLFLPLSLLSMIFDMIVS